MTEFTISYNQAIDITYGWNGYNFIEYDEYDYGVPMVGPFYVPVPNYPDSVLWYNYVDNGDDATGIIQYGKFYIESGGSGNNILVQNGGYEIVNPGATADDTIVGYHAGVEIFGEAYNTTINSSGGMLVQGEYVYSGSALVMSSALAEDIIVDNGGTLRVSSGGISDDTIINNGGTIDIEGDDVIFHGDDDIIYGSGENTIVESGARLTVELWGVTTATIVSSGGEMFVGRSGSAYDTSVESGGEMVVDGLGSAYDTSVESGGQLSLYSGFTADQTTVENATFVEIASGTNLDNYIVNNYAKWNVDYNANVTGLIIDGGDESVFGLTTNTHINSGGIQTIENYLWDGWVGSAYNTVIEANGSQITDGYTVNTVVYGMQTISSLGYDSTSEIESGGCQFDYGTTTDTTVDSGGDQTIYAAGSASDTHIYGVQYVESGGHDSGATIGDGGFQYVYGSAAGDTIDSGGTACVHSRGVMSDTTVDGDQIVSRGGNDSAAVIGDGGSQTIETGGTATSAKVQNGGYQDVYGSANDDTIDVGGSIDVYSGGTVRGAEIGGELTVSAGGSLSGAIVDNGTLDFRTSSGASATLTGSLAGSGAILVEGDGTAVIAGDDNLTGTITVTSGATLEVNGATSGGTISFVGSGDTLKIDGSDMPSNMISGFALGDTIDLAGVSFASDGTVTLTSGANGGSTLVVDEGGQAYDLNLAGATSSYTDVFQLSPGAGNTTAITLVPGVLFTSGSDTVDFNNLTPSQIAAINSGANPYNTLAGDDVVTLPTVGDYQLTPGVAWDPTQIFITGNGDDSVEGGDGNYKIGLGGGRDVVAINGNGSSTIQDGAGDDTISIQGDGNNTIAGYSSILTLFGGGTGSVTIDGTGSNVFSGDLTGSAWIGGGGSLDITGDLNGSATIAADSTLEIRSGGASSTISFAGPGATLEIDDPSSFQGKITGLTIGDKIELKGVNTQNNTGIYTSTIGQMNGLPTLLLQQGYANYSNGNYTTTGSPLYYSISGNTIYDDFFNASASGGNTILTLTQGNPIELAVNAGTVSETGSGIKIGIISGYTQTGLDEGSAMSQIVHDIAPDAFTQIDLINSQNSMSQMADDIMSLAASGCKIIVDDIAFTNPNEATTGSNVEQAIDDAVNNYHVSYFTSAGNYGQTAIFGHAADQNAITVGAINWLAVSQLPSVGNYLGVNSEPYSSGNFTGKPDISAPDGGPTVSFPLSSSLDPFFGTSAAAPAAAAIAALMMQAEPALEADPSLVKILLEESATPFGNSTFSGAGLVNAVEAINLATSSGAACYARGTHILTPHGGIAIEDLQIGDLIVTALGAAKPVKWLGRRKLDCSRHPDPRSVWPIRVSAGAFGLNRPSRDLWLSPGHNIDIGGALAQISALVNGKSVAQFECASVEYWHVELDEHDIIVAEGLPAESYLDTGNRTAFFNGGAFIEAHPDFKPRHWAETCLPLVFDGPQIVDAKALLLARLRAIGQATTSEADFHVLADGARIEPQSSGARRFRFALAADCADIRLISRTFIPAHTVATSADPRSLGVCVARLQIDGEEVALDDQAFLFAGWQEYEPGQRWTTGATPLPAGTRLVVVDLAGDGYYWEERRDAVAALFG